MWRLMIQGGDKAWYCRREFDTRTEAEAWLPLYAPGIVRVVATATVPEHAPAGMLAVRVGSDPWVMVPLDNDGGRSATM